METLATLATPDWFLEEAKKWCTIANGGRVSSHPIVLGMLHPDYLSFWPVFSLGDDLHTLNNVRPIPSRPRERPLAERLLEAGEFRGAAGEIAAAARLRRGGVRFEWYPPEGGDFSIQGDAIRFVEVKRRSYVSEAASSELNRYPELRAAIAAAVPGYEIEFALEPMQADGLGTRARGEQWNRITLELVSAAQELVGSQSVPGRCDRPLGTLWIGHSRDELMAIGAGTGGLALDEKAEARRALRSVVNNAISELPAGGRAVIYLEWPGARPEFELAVRKRLSHLTANEAIVTAVVLRGTIGMPGEIVPREWTRVIENPSMVDEAESAVVRALSTDHLARLQRGALSVR